MISRLLSKHRRLIIIITLLVVVMSMLSIPLRLPSSVIRAGLLLQMPLGSSEDEVVQFISRRNRWVLDDWITYAEPGSNSRGGLLARTRVVDMGHYWGIFLLRIDVVAFWRFDEDGKLFELIIRKYADVI